MTGPALSGRPPASSMGHGRWAMVMFRIHGIWKSMHKTIAPTLSLIGLTLTGTLACDPEATSLDFEDPRAFADPEPLPPPGVDEGALTQLGYWQGSFEIELHNDTPTQWFSPCLCALHHPWVDVFADGKVPSTGAATFAEDGFNGVFAEELRADPNVYAVLECAPGLTAPGETRTESLSGPAWARLSCAAMPVTTNDVLTTVGGAPLPHALGDSVDLASVEWDIGSEEDNYSPDSIPLDSVNLQDGAPTVLSFFSRAFAQDGVVTAEGSMEVFEVYEGSADFPAEDYGWEGSASTWTVTRVE